MLATSGVAVYLGPFPLDLIAVFPWVKPILMLVGALIVVPIGYWIFHRIRHRSEAIGLLFAWLISFMFLQAGAPPSARLLFVPAIGAMGLLSLFFAEQRLRKRTGRQQRVERTFVTGLWISAVVGSGAASLGNQQTMIAMSRYVVRQQIRDSELHLSDGETQRVFVLQGESQMAAFVLQSTWSFLRPNERAIFHNLQYGNRPLRWTQVDEFTFEIQTMAEPFLGSMFERVYLGVTKNFRAGDIWTPPSFRVEVVSVDELGMPTRLRFRLSERIDSNRILFIVPRSGRYERISPPGVGNTIELPRPDRVGPFMP